jgi:hypothetical protein
MYVIEAVTGLIFILSSGLLFSAKYRQNWFVVLCAGLFATISSYFVLEEVVKRIIEKQNESETISTPADRFFTDADLLEIAKLVDNKRCWEECTESKYFIIHLPIDNGRDGSKPYLVQTTDLGFCGSGGCNNAVMLFYKNRMIVVREGFGITEDQAMIIARDALRRR